MGEGDVVLIAREFLRVAVEVSGPVLAVGLVVGLTVSVVQVVTSIQDATFAYVLRLISVGLVLALLGRWMLHSLAAYTTGLWSRIPDLVG